uniref:Uncharacterized protein n=1 Tax=viral metagenome TaxID=1070528 RepID=A0A6M3IVN2_9ZZZZ
MINSPQGTPITSEQPGAVSPESMPPDANLIGSGAGTLPEAPAAPPGQPSLVAELAANKGLDLSKPEDLEKMAKTYLEMEKAYHSKRSDTLGDFYGQFEQPGQSAIDRAYMPSATTPPITHASQAPQGNELDEMIRDPRAFFEGLVTQAEQRVMAKAQAQTEALQRLDSMSRQLDAELTADPSYTQGANGFKNWLYNNPQEGMKFRGMPHASQKAFNYYKMLMGDTSFAASAIRSDTASAELRQRQAGMYPGTNSMPPPSTPGNVPEGAQAMANLISNVSGFDVDPQNIIKRIKAKREGRA